MKICFQFFVLIFRPTFGKLLDISGEGYLDAIDKENPDVVVVMHLYQPVSEVYCIRSGLVTSCNQVYFNNFYFGEAFMCY